MTVFNPRFSLWYEISFWLDVNWRQTLCSGLKIATRVVWSEWRYLSDLAQKPRERERLRLSRSIYHLNTARALLWNETHSGMKINPVSYNQPLESLSHVIKLLLTCKLLLR